MTTLDSVFFSTVGRNRGNGHFQKEIIPVQSPNIKVVNGGNGCNDAAGKHFDKIMLPSFRYHRAVDVLVVSQCEENAQRQDL